MPHQLPIRSVLNPTWAGDGFVEAEAQSIWLLLPAPLRAISVAEVEAGNEPEAIQLDLHTHVPVLTFEQPPRSPEPVSPTITIHRKHEFGNYCYDGTACTYESSSPRAFLAFTDPKYDHELAMGLKSAP